MAYIDYAFFKKYLGEQLDEITFEEVVGPACDLVDAVTNYKVAQGQLESLPAWSQELFKKACANQCAYLGLYGVDVAYTGVAGQGFTVGKVSIADAQKKSGGVMVNAISPAVYSLLQPTGLLYRGTAVCSDQYPRVFSPIVRF